MMMMDVRAASSPGPMKTPTDNAEKGTIGMLYQMHKCGIFTKEEVRKMVFQHMFKKQVKKQEVVSVSSSPKTTDGLPATAVPSPKATPSPKAPVPSPKTPNRSPRTRAVRGLQKLIQNSVDAVEKKVRRPLLVEKKNCEQKSQRKKVEEPVKDLRSIVKNPARRRFFDECLKPNSPLWYTTAGGKQSIDKLLLERATDDLVNILYKEHPGTLRNVREPVLRQAIHWQVMRDRNNYKGVSPKRKGYSGSKLSFNFVAAKASIQKAIDEAADLTQEDKYEPKSTVKSEPAMSSKGDVGKFVKQCLHCRRNVWIGGPSEKPKSVMVAYPKNNDWSNNVQPYCKRCWAKEDALLISMGAQHRAVGPKAGKAKKAPAKTKTKKAPAKTKTKKAPAKTRTKKAPAKTRTKKAPAKRKAPAETKTKKAPAKRKAPAKVKKTRRWEVSESTLTLTLI